MDAFDQPGDMGVTPGEDAALQGDAAQNDAAQMDASAADAAMEEDATREQAPPDDCTATCQWLEDCNLSCFQDEAGECLDVEGCAEVCRAEVPDGVATCAAELMACEEGGLQGCYDANIGDDDCANTCRRLEECDQCFTDEAGEDCLSLSACAAVCREVTDAGVAACLGALDSCDGIDACVGG